MPKISSLRELDSAIKDCLFYDEHDLEPSCVSDPGQLRYLLEILEEWEQ